MALGVVTLRTIEYIVGTSCRYFDKYISDGGFLRPKMWKECFLNTNCGEISTDFLFY